MTIVTIPNIIGKNSYDSYKPRISKAMKNEITAFINQLNTLHVTAEVINPTYEEIKVSLKVKFYKGFDEHFYTQQLKKDIAKLFSPWAFEQTNTIEFGVALHESFVIDYIEKLGYVDFITDFRMFQETGKNTAGNPVFTKKKKVVPTTAQSILTSVKYKDHDVSVLTKADTCTKIPEKVSV